MRLKTLSLIILIPILSACVSKKVEIKDNYWPQEELNAWYSLNEITTDMIPSLDEGIFEGTSLTDKNGNNYFMIEGKELIDSEETYTNKYLNALINNNWSIDDSDYENNGYYSISPNNVVLLNFITFEDEFTMWIHKIHG